MAAKKPAKKKAAAPIEVLCPWCGEAASMGMTQCPICKVEKCVDQCIPGGVRTACVSCLEAEDFIDDETEDDV